jgi:ABC-type sugar transport system ATPase subunit
VPWPSSVRRGLRYGIALAPEERKTEGLVLSLTAEANLTLSRLRSVSVGPFVSSARRRDRAAALADSLAFDRGRLKAVAGTLSGGNQQKLVIGRCIDREPRILLLDEPTRGIDIGAKGEMLRFITELADRGMSVVVVSSELEEVVDLADRVLVVARGRSVATMSRDDASVKRVLSSVFDSEGSDQE